ncbi:replication initiator protein A [Enterococcus casseliflavus]|uniref:replication initiator protein A n=1 Tax=Enterococcus casseliflavus TaxID=37734 RepID=UPI00232CF801|nr:replication initiator protein A [Enterococcus casseliflavus]MDB1690206.1 replication initiator protein A [Enterococcus casseliflavus]
MSNFNFYTANEVYAEKYFQLPKVFFTNEKYKKMSNDSKVAYAILKDRFSYSVKNKWVDKQNRIYFVFTVEELKDMLNCAEGKVAKVKKELTEMNLLFQERGGSTWINGVKVNTPNKLYLGKPEATAEDVYLIDQAESQASSGIAKTANPEKAQSNNEKSGIAKTANPEKDNDTKRSSGIAKTADNLYYTPSLDTNRHLIDTREAEQEAVLLENFVTLMQDDSIATFVPENALSLIKTFSSTLKDAKKTVKIIHNAKYKAEQVIQTKIVFEELPLYGVNTNELYNTLLKAYQKQKTETVTSMDNLIFTYVKNWFIEKAGQAVLQANQQQPKSGPKIPMHDWSESV